MSETTPRCPHCHRRENVQPLTLGLVGGYPATVEFQCTACGCVFERPKQEYGYLTREIVS